ncbi:MAG: OsmC family protein [Legionellaceae bacterium]|nr:OsmC family protein [Legionellaceae bacterium]
MKRSGSAEWKGNLKDGKGTVSTESGILHHTPYSFKMRFEDAPGTNPEELIAAAHAACFSMAFSAQLEKEGLKAESINTSVSVSLEKSDEGFFIPFIHLQVSAKIPHATQAIFQKAATSAKEGCPVSKLMKASITMDATLES